jgi:hypothetical protein
VAVLKHTLRISEIIRYLYGLPIEERGHKTIGHICLTSEDNRIAANTRSDLLYGEVLPEGVVRMLDADHLDVAHARTVYDLGSGLGKLALQAFLQYPHLEWVGGVELAQSRSSRAFEALRRLTNLQNGTFTTSQNFPESVLTAARAVFANDSTSMTEEAKDGCSIRYTEVRLNPSTYSKCLGRSKRMKKTRYLELRNGDLFGVSDAWLADIVICETKFPEERYNDLTMYLQHLKPTVRLLTYEDLDNVYALVRKRNPFVRMESNHPNDRFFTTWAPNYGYKFHLWTFASARISLDKTDGEKNDRKVAGNEESI